MKFLKELIYPSTVKCIVCDEELCREVRNGVCDKCKLPYIVNYCTVCGRSVPPQNTVCDQCKSNVYPFEAARSCFVYKEGAATLVRRLKYRDARYLAPFMAEFMADVYCTENWDADIITSVPVHRSRIRERGYNQSELIADALGKILHIKSENLLEKPIKTADLIGHTRVERAEIIKDSFTLVKDANTAGKSVMLIDDVFTTGATACECARTLKNGGAKCVYVLTFASGEYNAAGGKPKKLPQRSER